MIGEGYTIQKVVNWDPAKVSSPRPQESLLQPPPILAVHLAWGAPAFLQTGPVGTHRHHDSLFTVITLPMALRATKSWDGWLSKAVMPRIKNN